MPRDTVGYTAGTGSLVETYPDATDGAIRESTVITDPENRRAAYVTTDNRLQVKTDYTAPAAITAPAVSATSVTLIAADATNGRVNLILFNDTQQTAYVRLDATAATTAAYSFEMAPGAYWESPRNFVGAATCIWASATGGGNMRVTAL